MSTIGKTERVILLKGDSTKWYEQAIFIVNQDTPVKKMPVDFVAEAEKIINNYMVKEKKLSAPSSPPYRHPATIAPPSKPTKKKRSNIDFTLNLMMILACIAIIAVFIYGILL
ncbi:MAG: hypothetical protein FWE05_04650 [Defluviitaleaceae bacterium]|nr:hypothetical protein [Defluviitaleaceae bacterium]